MTGSALKRWTLYEDCFSERMLELGGGPGRGELKIGPDRRDADFCGGCKSMAGAVFSSLLRKNSILDVLKT